MFDDGFHPMYNKYITAGHNIKILPIQTYSRLFLWISEVREHVEVIELTVLCDSQREWEVIRV